MSVDGLAAGFMVIHGNQPELLRQLLVHWFRTHPLEPLENEVILVQSNGMAQWLKLALAANAGAGPDGGCGIAASLGMSLPSRFVWQMYRAVLGQHHIPETSPFDKPLLVWRLMRLLPGVIHTAGFEPLHRFLADDGDLRKRFQLAEKIADLFDQYQVYRADWLEAWANGRDVLCSARGQVRPLPATQCWQAMLWRVLLDDVGPDRQCSRASIHQRFLAAAAELAARPAGVPRRVSVFGLSSLPRQSLDALQAISHVTQVLLYVHNPCEYYWADLLSGKDIDRRVSARHASKAGLPLSVDDETLHLHAHPLLASWGKQGSDYIALLDELDRPDNYRGRFERVGERIDVFESHGEATLLNQLQDDILKLRSADETRSRWQPVDPGRDRSLRFHVAHSIQREIEILHDQLLAAFDADATLKPRDIIVMVPDVNAYAPHIEAVFGLVGPGEDRYIPFSIADQAQRHQMPLARALECLLGLTESRLSVSNVLDLLDVPAVQRRFGFSADDLPLLHRWIDETRIRWGLDAAHREQFVSHAGEQNTWAHGLRRMLLGYAIGNDPAGREDDDWRGIEPYGEVAGLTAALAGPLARLLIELETVVTTFATPATPAAWDERFGRLLQTFFDGEAPEDAVLLARMQQGVRDWIDACVAARLDEPLPLAVVREQWLTQIDLPNLAQRFLAGQLTFATLMPMRAIPFRMVCLLGMNDGDFPRSRPPVDFDLMATDLRPGDRSRRDDDRYLFLEAVLSAREALHISWIGRSIQDNTERPPSVLVSQLRDHLQSCWRLCEPAPAPTLLAALTVEHRLQPFNADYFGQDPAGSPLFTYAREWARDGGEVHALPENIPLPPPVFEAPVTLGQLIAFLKDPVKTFFRQRLGVYYEFDELTSEDQEPFSLDGLRQWSLQDALIQARLDALCSVPARDPVEAAQRELDRIRRRGELPLGKMADVFAQSLVKPLDDMFDDFENARKDWPTPLDDWLIDHPCVVGGQTLRIQGRITHCYAATEGRCRIEVNSSDLLDERKYRRDKLIAAWVLHLAAHLDGQPTHSRIIGKNGEAPIRPLDPAQAAFYLQQLVEAYVDGLTRPLPVAPKTAFAWIGKGGEPVSGSLDAALSAAVSAAQARYSNAFDQTGEGDTNAYLQRCYPTFEHLWSAGHFSHLCDVLYKPLADAVGAAVNHS